MAAVAARPDALQVSFGTAARVRPVRTAATGGARVELAARLRVPSRAARHILTVALAEG